MKEIILWEIEKVLNELKGLKRMEERKDLRIDNIVLEKELKNIIKKRIRRKRIMIGMVLEKLGRRRFRDDILRDKIKRREKWEMRKIMVEKLRKRIEMNIVKVIDRIEEEINVEIKSGIKKRNLGIVEGSKKNRKEFVRDWNKDSEERKDMKVLLGKEDVS